MIERFEMEMKEANIYALLFIIVGQSFASLALELNVPVAEIEPILTLCFVVSVVLLLWGFAWRVIDTTSEASTGETA